MTSSNVELRNITSEFYNVELRNYVISRQDLIKYPLNPPWCGVGQFFLGECQSRIYPHIRAKFGHGPMIMSKIGGLQTHRLRNFYKYVGYNTANNLSNFGGDTVTQLIVNVYQMIKL